MHKLKDKGDTGVLYIATRMTELGWTVAFPLSEHAPYDLLAEKEGHFHSIQARYSTPVNGVARVKLKSSWADKHGNHYKLRKESDFTLLGVYIPDAGIVFIGAQEFSNAHNISIRLSKSANNQSIGIRYFDDFQDIPLYPLCLLSR